MDPNPEVRETHPRLGPALTHPSRVLLIKITMKSKPLFRWTHAARTVRERMDLAVSVQKFFFLVVEKGLDASAVSRNYPTEIEVFKDSMAEVGVAVDGPAWFSNLFR